MPPLVVYTYGQRTAVFAGLRKLDVHEAGSNLDILYNRFPMRFSLGSPIIVNGLKVLSDSCCFIQKKKKKKGKVKSELEKFLYNWIILETRSIAYKYVLGLQGVSMTSLDLNLQTDQNAWHRQI